MQIFQLMKEAERVSKDFNGMEKALESRCEKLAALLKKKGIKQPDLENGQLRGELQSQCYYYYSFKKS